MPKMAAHEVEPRAAASKWYCNEQADPVFEGMVKEFGLFDEALQSIAEHVEAFMEGVRQLAEGLLSVADSIFADLSRSEDRFIASESCKLRAATNQIVRDDAPQSAIARLQRNIEFNAIKPIESHLANNEKLKKEFEKRRRRLQELRDAYNMVDECIRLELSTTDYRFEMAENELEISKREFEKQDRHVFEWLYILEMYRSDILDSLLQTLKFLQYDFFSMSAHALSGILPGKMEFLPMAEMIPECLEAKVELELKSTQDVEGGFSARLISRLARDSKAASPSEPVDALSLSSLLMQGFDEGPARRALRLHRNDTQAALDWLVEGGADEVPRVPSGDGSRAPNTREQIQSWEELRRQMRERLHRRERRERNENEIVALPVVGLGLSVIYR